MQETGNNCFGSKKRSATLRQAKTGKHECRKVTVTYYNNCCEFLASYGVTFQSVIKSCFKTPVFGAPLSYSSLLSSYKNRLSYCITHLFLFCLLKPVVVTSKLDINKFNCFFFLSSCSFFQLEIDGAYLPPSHPLSMNPVNLEIM